MSSRSTWKLYMHAHLAPCSVSCSDLVVCSADMFDDVHQQQDANEFWLQMLDRMDSSVGGAFQRLCAVETQMELSATHPTDSTTMLRLEPTPAGQSSYHKCHLVCINLIDRSREARQQMVRDVNTEIGQILLTASGTETWSIDNKDVSLDTASREVFTKAPQVLAIQLARIRGHQKLDQCYL